MLGMGKKTTETTSNESVKVKDNNTFLRKNQSTIKDIIAPGGIDASYTNHIAVM